MKIQISSKWVKPGENIFKGDIVKIVDEGKYVPGKFGTRLEFQLQLPSKEVKTYNPSMQTIVNLKQEFGDDSKVWIGKELKAWVFEQIKKGEIYTQLVLTPKDWQEVVKPKEPKVRMVDNIPVIEDETIEGEDEINMKDIPF